MKKKKIIIIAIIAIIVLAVIGVSAFLILTRDTEEKQEKLKWGEVYLEVLNDEEKTEDMEDLKIQLCDLDQDEIPELIVYGIKGMSEYLANIYKINDKNEVDTVKVSLDKEFDLKLMYNLEESEYNWYAVSGEENDKEIYDLNIKTEKYEAEKLELDYEKDFVPVEENYSEKVDFDKEASKKEKKEKLNTAKDGYIKTDEMITTEIEEKVEIARTIRNVEKIDSDKDLVYSVVEKGNYKYPAINVNSEDVKKINEEIEKEYGFKANEIQELQFSEIEEITYEYYTNGKILSLIIKKGGNQSVWTKTYNINLEKKSELIAEDLINEKGLDKTEIIQKVEEVATKEFESIIEKDKKGFASYWDSMYSDEDTTKWKTELQNNCKNLENTYLNKDGDLCAIIEFEHPGGQWSCTMSIVINITKNYIVEELKLNNGMSSQNTSYPKASAQPSTTPSPSPSATTTTTPAASSNTIQMTKFTYDTSVNNKVPEGTYNGPMGTLTITNSTGNSFDFKFDCMKMTAAGYPNLGMMEGTAKTITGGNYVYAEHTGSGEYQYDYNIFFYLAGGDSNMSITVDDECSISYTSPYCGNGVSFEGTYEK